MTATIPELVARLRDALGNDVTIELPPDADALLGQINELMPANTRMHVTDGGDAYVVAVCVPHGQFGFGTTAPADENAIERGRELVTDLSFVDPDHVWVDRPDNTHCHVWFGVR